MLAGATGTNPTYDKSPYKLDLPARAGDMLVLRFTSTHAPITTRNCLIQVTTAGGTVLTSRTSVGNGGLLQLAVWLTATETVSVRFFNAASATGALHPEALTWAGTVRLEPYTKAPEPDSDNSPATINDTLRDARSLTTLPTTWTSRIDALWHRDALTGDIEDWHRFTRPGNATAEFEVTPELAPGENWTFLMRLYAASGTLLAESTAFTTGPRVVQFPSTGTGEALYLQVSATPTGQTPPTNRVYYARYTLRYRQVAGTSGISIQGFTPTVRFPLGYPGEEVTLGAIFEGGPPTAYEWSGRSGLPTSNFITALDIPNPVIRLPQPGSGYQARLRVTGSFTSAFTADMDFAVGFRVPPSFATLPMASQSLEVGEYIDSKLLTDDLPAICYRDSASEDLYFARALVADPDGPSDWVAYRVAGANGARVGRWCQLEVVNDCPVIAHYNDSSGNLSVARSVVPAPSASTDWVNVPIDTAGAGQWPALWQENDRIEVAFRGASGGIRFARALNAFPAVKADFAVHTVDADAQAGVGLAIGGAGSGSLIGSLVRLGSGSGDPYEVRLWMADQSLPTQTADWIRVLDLPDPGVGARPDGPDSWGTLSIVSMRGALVGCYDTTRGGYRLWYGDTPTITDGWIGAVSSGFLVPGTFSGGREAVSDQQGRPMMLLHDGSSGATLMGRCSSDEFLQKSNWLFTSLPGGFDSAPAPLNNAELSGAIGDAPGTFGLQLIQADSFGW